MNCELNSVKGNSKILFLLGSYYLHIVTFTFYARTSKPRPQLLFVASEEHIIEKAVGWFRLFHGVQPPDASLLTTAWVRGCNPLDHTLSDG